MSRDALIVGINHYQYLPEIKAPASDAEAIAQRLEKDGDFNKVQRLPEAITSNGDQQPVVSTTLTVSQLQLEQALEQIFLPGSKQAPDTALFYFSGHGLSDNKGYDKGYLATSDTNPGYPRSGLSLRWLQWLLSESPVQQQIIWLDCCHSGALIVNVGAANPGSSASRDRCFIASSRDFESSWEDVNSPYSVLTKALLDGLDPTRLPGRWIDTFALVDFVNQALHGEQQIPVCTHFGEAINLTRTWQVEATKTNKSTATSVVCPYKGLDYFDCNDEDPKYFYGRQLLTDKLLDKVRTSNFIALVGASGSGKSSVLRAGLLHQLKLGHRIFGSSQWPIHLFLPGKHPLQSLAQAFVNPDQPPLDRAEQLSQAENLIGQGAEGLRRLVQASSRQRVLLVVDQFEEAFTLCQDLQERQQFFQSLLEALPITEPICLILAMRADFFGKCLEHNYSGLAQQIEQHLVTIPPLSCKELRQAIVKPAEQAKLEVEAELVDEMIQAVEKAPSSLPLLQFTLTELWKQRQDNCLKLTTYSRIGGVSGTLGKRATELYNQFPTEQQATVRHVFLSLTHLGEATEDSRRRIYQTDLVTPLHPMDLVETVVKKLADEKLVVTSQVDTQSIPPEPVAVLEVSHEALIREWPLCRQWITEKRDLLRQSRKLEMAAEEWRSQNQQVSYLLQGRRLSDARKFQNRYQTEASLSALADEFIERSVQIQRTRRFALGISGIAIIFLSMILYPYLLGQVLRQRAIFLGETVYFQPGEAIIGTDEPNADPEEQPEWKVFLPAFRIEKFEVSNRQYRLCMTARVCSGPAVSPYLINDRKLLNYPVVGVTAYQAFNYCQWIGRRLPTELEWERAARGPEGRQWPWGNEPPTPEHANIRFEKERSPQVITSFDKGVSKEGVFNLVGNTWEWTSSYYQESYLPPYSQTLIWDGDPASIGIDPKRAALILRGGSGTTDLKRVTFRLPARPDYTDRFTGIRCAGN